MHPMDIAVTAVGAAFVAAIVFVLGFWVRHRRAHAFAHGAGVRALAGTMGSLSTSLRVNEPGWMPGAAPSKFARFLTLR
jgi:hypothetical protein